MQQKTQSRIYPESNTTNSRANSRAIQTDLETRSDAITPEALNHSHDDLESADITAYNSPNPTHSGGTPPDHYSDPYIDGNCNRKIVPIPENKDGESSVHLQTNSLDQPIQTPSGRGKLTSSHSSVGRHAISESIKIVANELKILPFMDGLKRHQYEEFVIAEYITGEFEDED